MTSHDHELFDLICGMNTQQKINIMADKAGSHSLIGDIGKMFRFDKKLKELGKEIGVYIEAQRRSMVMMGHLRQVKQN